jgi:hypothetical protein
MLKALTSTASFPNRGVKGRCGFSSVGSVKAKVTGVSGIANSKKFLYSGPIAIFHEVSSSFQDNKGDNFKYKTSFDSLYNF